MVGFTIGTVLVIALYLGLIIAFFWSLDALRTLKDGQVEILKRLDGLESLNRSGAAAVIPDAGNFVT